ncbi:hypothetical protein ACIQ4I_16495 [Rummeliibacillus sp. NPDC094406]|uniref:hypothetical protein n=1 Tax=Rummeliibacillus sp. NPDC094406 TaxID=3364511 RepID=UPI00380FCAFF
MPKSSNPKPSKPITLTTGPVWRNPNTERVVVNVLNVSDKPQTVTVSVIDRTNCLNQETAKMAFICGAPATPVGIQPSVSSCDPLSDPTCNAVPVTFTISPQSTLAVHAFFSSPFLPGAPMFEARVTGPFSASSIYPPNPCRISMVGIDTAGVPQIGNVFNMPDFVVTPPSPV